MSYNLSTSMGGWPIPSYGVNCELDRRVLDDKGMIVKNGEHNSDGHCCIIGLNHIAKVQWGGNGGTGKCSVCGTPFVYGDVWKHIPTGEYIHVGHQCAAKYSLMADRSAWDMHINHLKAETAIQIQKKLNQERREAFLEEHPTVKDDIELDHPIIADLKINFKKWCGLTEKQLILLTKLANDVRNPKPEEPKANAPEGREKFTGEVVSLKLKNYSFGDLWRITVKVTTDNGIWLAWGTCPKALLTEDSKESIKGKQVDMTATLTPSDDKPFFAFFKRPNGKLVK